jgi:LuxR family maltose regulon positive regulatory protein
MSDALLLTKLYVPPPRSNLVFRPRLLEQLNKGLSSGRKLTLISAPAGFGKTTLVSEWVAGPRDCPPKLVCGNSVAWLSLDEADNDPARFISYLVAALQTILPGIGESLLPALQSPQPLHIETLLTALLNEVSKIPEHFVLILDDYHSIDSRPVDRALDFLVEHQPPQMHLVITTREDPQLPLARYRARGQLTELRAADLRFTPGEAAELLNQVTGLGLSVENIAALETRTEGWVAGLQLAAISMQGHKDAAGFIQSFTGSHRFVMDYLIEEVLQQQSESIQAFLLHTSMLERMCGPLCDAILPDSSVSGQATLEYLERANLFIVPLDNERRWYRYHHLFGDLLRRRMEQKLSADGIARLHIHASEWYENNGLILEAFNHAAAANDIERAEWLMEHKDMPLHLPGVPMTILNWLESLPVSVLNSKPALWWKQASMMLISYQTIGVEEKLQATEAALTAKIPPHEEMDEWSRNLVGKIAVARAMLAQTLYQAETSLEYAHRAMEYLHPNNTAYRSTATQVIGFALYVQGDRDAAQQAYTEALSLAQAAGDNDGVLMATIRLGQILELRNQLHQAEETYQHVLQLMGDDPPPLATVGLSGLARIYLEWNELDSAEKYAEQAFQLAKLCEQVIDRLIESEMVLSRLKLARGDAEGAAHWLSQAEKNARQNDLIVRLPDIASAQALIHLYRGDTGAAFQIAQQYDLLQYDQLQHDILIIRARALIAQGDSSAVLEILIPYCPQMEEKKWEDQRLRAMVLQALAHHLQGDKDSARQVLTEALTLAEPGGFIRLFVDNGESMRSLIVDFKSWIEKQSGDRNHPLREYVDKLLAAFEPLKPVLGSTTTNPQSELVEPLSQRELEVLQLICQGLSNQEICQRLFLALDTVKGHNRRIFEKLQVHRRTEAIARARELKLF